MFVYLFVCWFLLFGFFCLVIELFVRLCACERTMMKVSILILGSIAATAEIFRYDGSSVYTKAGLDTKNGEIQAGSLDTCWEFAKKPQPNPPKEHVLGLYFESWKLDEGIRKAPWDKITHAYYSFTAPSVRCGIPITPEAEVLLRKWLDAGKTLGKGKVRMIMALGGWADTRHFSW